MKILQHNVICPYCAAFAELVPGEAIHGAKARPGLKFWVCWPCSAWVGVHRNSKINAPYGRLANKELRRAKQAAHEAFDPIWRDGHLTRIEAYTWLAAALGIKKLKQCHIGQFDEETCARVVAVSTEFINRQKEKTMANESPLINEKLEDLIRVPIAAGKDRAEFQVKNMLIDGQPAGDWQVTIERKAGPQPQRATFDNAGKPNQTNR